MRSLNNKVSDNDMSDLKIKEPDSHSDKHADGRRFADSLAGSDTAHVWLDAFSENNSIRIRETEKVIDEGKENTIEYF